jgi:hypothetical protein
MVFICGKTYSATPEFSKPAAFAFWEEWSGNLKEKPPKGKITPFAIFF